DGGLAGDDQHRRGDLLLAQPAHQMYAVEHRQHVVGDDQIDAGARQRETGFAVLGDEDLALGSGQQLGERIGLRRIVLDDQDAHLGVVHQAAPGSMTVKVVPLPGSLSTRMSPPCWRAISRLMVRPSPVPVPPPPRKKGVNRRGRSAGEMPGPRSTTVTCALSRLRGRVCSSGTPSTSMRGAGLASSGSPAPIRTAMVVPASEYWMAFPTRLVITCTSRSKSPITYGAAESAETSTSIDFISAIGFRPSTADRATSARSSFSRATVNAPASIRDSSSVRSTIFESRADSDEMTSRPRCARAGSIRASWAYPPMPLSG